MKNVISISAIIGIFIVAVTSTSFSASLFQQRCAGCHGSTGNKHALGTSPLLKGQSKEDIIKKLNGYQEGTYGGSKKNIMQSQAKSLSNEQIEKLAEEISGF